MRSIQPGRGGARVVVRGERTVEGNGPSWPMDAMHAVRPERGSLEVPDDLRRVANGTVSLTEAFLALTRYQEEQAHAAADLLEREVWALTAILVASEPIWAHLDTPTLCFTIPPSIPEANYHLELGHFAHLAGLAAPSASEQALAATATVTWARVYPHLDRRAAGQSGALARSYVPISVE